MEAFKNSAVTLAAIQEHSKATFSETLGLEFTEVGENYVKGALTVDSRHLRPGNIANGGVFLAMIETVASVAARCAIHGQKKNTLGVQVNANHLKVAVPGDRLTGTARPVHLGKSTQLWEVSIENQKSQLVSKGTITLLVVDA